MHSSPRVSFFFPPDSFPRHAQRLQAEEQGDPHRDGAVRRRLLPVTGQSQLRLFAPQTELRPHSPCDSVVQKGAKEFVDQNMLRSQRSRRRRKQQQQQQQRSSSSNCAGPSESAEEAKQGESDHETTSSSGDALAYWLWGFFLPAFVWSAVMFFVVLEHICMNISYVSIRYLFEST